MTTDLPAGTLILASLCSPGCLPQANLAWEHRKAAGKCRTLLTILLVSHSWSQIKALSQGSTQLLLSVLCPGPSLARFPCLLTWSAFLALMGAG